MTALSQTLQTDLRSPDQISTATDYERLVVYTEDWVTEPNRADSGQALGPDSQRQVAALLARGITESDIQTAALDDLSAQEARISARHLVFAWLAFFGCVGLAVLAAVFWTGYGKIDHSMKIMLMGAIGLMLAHGIRMYGVRRRSRLIRSRDARMALWRSAIERLS